MCALASHHSPSAATLHQERLCVLAQRIREVMEDQQGLAFGFGTSVLDPC